MLGLGTDLIYPQYVAVGGEIQLAIASEPTYIQIFNNLDDENVPLRILAEGQDTYDHITNGGALSGIGVKLNCTIELTFQRMDGATVLETSNPATFNCFDYAGSFVIGDVRYQDMLISSETTGPLNILNYFASGVGTADLTSLNGSDVTDGGDSLGQYRVSAVLKSDGALDSASQTSNAIPIDAA